MGRQADSDAGGGEGTHGQDPPAGVEGERTALPGDVYRSWSVSMPMMMTPMVLAPSLTGMDTWLR
jgi:hypothetical protein